MALKDRIQRAHRMTVPRTEPEPHLEYSIVKVYGVEWDGAVCSVSDTAVYKHEGKAATRDEDGHFHYEDGTPLKGLIITVNGDVTP